MERKKWLGFASVFIALILMAFFALTACTSDDMVHSQAPENPEEGNPVDTEVLEEDAAQEEALIEMGKFYHEASGFFCEYPSKMLSLSNEAFFPSNLRNMLFVIEITKIEDIQEGTLGYDIETSRQDEKSLQQGDYGQEIDFAFAPSQKVLFLEEATAKEFMVFSRFELCSVVFERKAIFYKNGYQFILTVAADPEEMIKGNPKYFILDKDCGSMPIWVYEEEHSSQEDFYRALTNQELSSFAQQWLEAYDFVISGILFSPPALSGDIDSEIRSGEDGMIIQRFYEDFDQEKNYEITCLAPEFLSLEGVPKEHISSLNRIIMDIQDEEILDFKSLLDELGDPDPSDARVYINTLERNYEISLINQTLVSIVFSTYSYTGGAHPAMMETTLAYDLQANRPIALEDIFEEDFDHLAFISQTSIEDIQAQIRSRGNEPMTEWIENGAGPHPDHFKNFILTQDALIVKFNPYQVAPYAEGSFDVMISYEAFLPHIRKGSALDQTLSQ